LGPVDSSFLGTLVAMAGHDLRQPLQLITNAHDALSKTLRSKEQRQELAEAADATSQMARMLSQLVEALHLEEQSHEDLDLPVPLQPILEELMAAFDKPARRKGITLRVMTARGMALSHPVLLTGMLRNLVRNAIDYTPRGGRVFVCGRQHGAEMRIEVTDTGSGIRTGTMPAIFNAFQRADQSRSDGLGLGLFIVKRAADLLGHRIEVQSAEGRGTRFTVVARVARCRLHRCAVR
jgi:signal transduction histidine kinase